MNAPSLKSEPARVDEPTAVEEFSDVLTRVAKQNTPVIVRRNGEDFAAVIPLDVFELVREIAGRQDAERLAASINWKHLPKTPPPQEWFDDDDNPFEPEKEPAP